MNDTDPNPRPSDWLKQHIRKPLPTEQVRVEAWDATVTVRAMTGVERAKVEAAAANARRAKLSEDEIGVRTIATAIRWSVVKSDPAGEHAFDDDDIAALEAGNGSALNTLWPVIDRLSRLTRRAIEVEKKD